MLGRHDLAWLTDAGWNAAIDGAPEANQRVFAQWRDAGWPAVVRRSDAGARDGSVALGIALPPQADGAKPRIAMLAAQGHIARTQGPLALDQAIASAPAPWHGGLERLCAAAHGLSLRVYGSLALQAITGLAYVRPTSDIDLLFAPRTAAELEAGLDLLRSHGDSLPLDGELVFPSGAAVAWREWLQAEAGVRRVLVKERSVARLVAPADLYGLLAA
jgi:phosphoribosyl-dephospho-CoA transferase